MTVNEFMKQLSNLSPYLKGRARKWIRERKGNYCPITAVCKQVTGKKYILAEYKQAASDIGIRSNIAIKIAEAADMITDGEMRYKLEAALK